MKEGQAPRGANTHTTAPEMIAAAMIANMSWNMAKVCTVMEDAARCV